MDYAEITRLALSYADRQDDEVVSRIDDFLLLVESKLSRELKIQKMSGRTRLITKDEQEYYGLPSDFLSLRDIEIQGEDDSRTRQTLKYLSPEQLNQHANSGGQDVYYTIIADQLQIMPPQVDKILEIVYYKAIPHLSEEQPTNWLSEFNPDAYIYGLAVEINSFVKDAQATSLWALRFQEVIDSMISNDASARWSGTALQTRVET